MTIAETPSSRIPPPEDAHCLGCGYALRELTLNRCPECGRAFDPTQPWTMDLENRRLRTRLVEWLASPINAGVRRTVLTSCGIILWGAAWLPGGFVIESIGWAALILAVTYNTLRRIAQRITRIRRGQPPLPRPPTERYTRRQTLLVFLAMTSPLFFWPLRLNVLLHRPLLDRYAWHAYAERPMIHPPSTPRMVGLFLVTSTAADARGTHVTVFAAGSMYWAEDGPRQPYRSYHWIDSPWFLRENVGPTCGRWYLFPAGRLELLRLLMG